MNNLPLSPSINSSTKTIKKTSTSSSSSLSLQKYLSSSKGHENGEKSESTNASTFALNETLDINNNTPSSTLNSLQSPTLSVNIPKYNQELGNAISLIFACGKSLNFQMVTVATAIVYFHKFYAVHKYNFVSFDKHIMIITSLFLSGKVEECPRKLRDVIVVCFGVCNPNSTLEETEKIFQYLRNEVLTHEILLLKTVGFDFNIDHPHKYILRYSFKNFPSDFNEAKFRQTAWNFANDSLYAPLCLRYSAPIIAAAVMELAAKYLKIEFPLGKTPGEYFHATNEDLKTIRNEIIDQYQYRPGHGLYKMNSSNDLNSNSTTLQQNQK